MFFLKHELLLIVQIRATKKSSSRSCICPSVRYILNINYVGAQAWRFNVCAISYGSAPFISPGLTRSINLTGPHILSYA